MDFKYKIDWISIALLPLQALYITSVYLPFYANSHSK